MYFQPVLKQPSPYSERIGQRDAIQPNPLLQQGVPTGAYWVADRPTRFMIST